MKRFVLLIIVLLAMITPLEAKYFTEIRVGAFQTKSRAQIGLTKLQHIIDNDQTLHALMKKWHFKATHRTSGKYYVTVVKPFKKPSVLITTLHALRQYYKSSYPERIYSKTATKTVKHKIKMSIAKKHMSVIYKSMPIIKQTTKKSILKKQEAIIFLPTSMIMPIKQTATKQPKIMQDTYSIVKSVQKIKQSIVQPIIHKTLSKKEQLFNAIVDNNIKKVANLLSLGMDINAKNRYRQTPLIVVAPHGSLDMIKFLVLHGANIHGRDFFHNTPLYNAAASNSVKVIKFLISHGANIYAKNYNGSTAIFNAAFGGNLRVLKFLISQGESIHTKDDNGDTPLFWAASNGQLSVVKFLISHGAKIKLFNKYGATPPDLAQANSHLRVLNYLMSHVDK